MKFLKIILTGTVILSVSAYILLFTKPGNKILKPYIENGLRKNIGAEISLTSFNIKPATFKITGKIESASFIIDGKYNLFKASVAGVYKLDIKEVRDIKKLFNIKTDIQGNYFGTGSFSGDKEGIIIDGKGKFDEIDIDYKTELIKFAPASLNIKIHNADFKKVTDIIDKPNYYMFNSPFNATLNYDLKTEQGNFTATFKSGNFVANRLTETMLTFTGFDITTQVYDNASIKGNINKKIVTADLNMKNEYTKISAKNAVIDIQNNTIEALLNINIKDKPVSVTIEDDIDNPEVKLNISKYIKTEIKKKTEEYIGAGNEAINKILKKIF